MFAGLELRSLTVCVYGVTSCSDREQLPAASRHGKMYKKQESPEFVLEALQNKPNMLKTTRLRIGN